MLTRRTMLAGAPLALAACAPLALAACASMEIEPPGIDPTFAALYGPVDDEPWPLAAIDLSAVSPALLRREVAYTTDQPVGTVVVDPAARFLHLVGEGGRAIRYGIGVGKVEAFDFAGVATVGRKAEWPSWRPTEAMIAREPERYGALAGGLPGGPGNPLGPRAIYLYQGGADTLYRLHGTVEPRSIGARVSSGCVRLFNQDIIDLYRRVPVGSRVVVLPPATA